MRSCISNIRLERWITARTIEHAAELPEHQRPLGGLQVVLDHSVRGEIPKLVPALLQRAKIHKTQDDFSGALADYSEAIRLEPKTAAVWSERGFVCLLQHDYESAINDEAQAIRLDPKLARAWFLRGAAYGDLGDSPNAVSDVATAVGIDPSLDRYISSKGKTTTLMLPPL